MKRVLGFFTSLKAGTLKDEAFIENNSSKEIMWKDNVIKALSIIGVTIALGSLPLSSYASALQSSHKSSMATYQQEGNEIIRDMYIQGLLSSKYKMNVVKLSSTSDSDASIIPGKTCQVSWALNTAGEAQNLISGINLTQTPLYRDMALLHEVSHCELVKIKDPFRNSGLNAKSEKFINSWVIGPQIPHTPINNFFSENFADTYGMLMLLKKNSFSQDSINELNRWYEIRKVKREMDERAGEPITYDPHYTDFSLKEIIDRLPEIKTLSPIYYKDLALEISSHSTLEWLNKTRLIQIVNNTNPDGKDVQPLGDTGVNFLLGNLQSGQNFYDALIGQAQLDQAEKQKIIQKLPESESDKLLHQIVSTYNISSDNIKVKMNPEHNLRWDNSSTNENEEYINQILEATDQGDYINKWKKNNDWNFVSYDIRNNLSKNIANKKEKIDNVVSVSKIKEKINNLSNKNNNLGSIIYNNKLK